MIQTRHRDTRSARLGYGEAKSNHRLIRTISSEKNPPPCSEYISMTIGSDHMLSRSSPLSPTRKEQSERGYPSNGQTKPRTSTGCFTHSLCLSPKNCD